MSFTVENLEKNMAKLTIEVSAEDFEKALQKAYEKNKNKIAVNGFRKGKVPRAVIEKVYGAGVFYEDAANILIPEEYSKAAEESKLDIVSQPEIDVTQIEKGKSFIFTAEVALKPEVTLGEYLGVEIEKTDAKVTADDERTHSVKLMPMIDNMFKASNLSLDNIDLLACCLGPGSFTGIRIGIATMKAFADVKNIPTVGVTSLESLAYNIEENATICPNIDCKNNNVYSAMFELKDNTYVQIGDNIADTIEVALENCKLHSENPIVFIGDGSVLHKDLILEKFANKDIRFSDKNIQSSVSLARCAYDKYLKGEYGDSSNISPLYLRKSQAERAMLEQ